MTRRFPSPDNPSAPRGGQEPRINLWRLPRLVSIVARRVSYPQPRAYYIGTERRETRQAVELRVETSEPLPVRAVTPILVIGQTAIPDYITEAATVFRFLAYEPDRLELGAPIRWGWPGPVDTLGVTRFRFSLGPAPGHVASVPPGPGSSPPHGGRQNA